MHAAVTRKQSVDQKRAVTARLAVRLTDRDDVVDTRGFGQLFKYVGNK